MDREANVEQTDGHGESLEQVEQRFRRWRESRKQGKRIPADLWVAAAGMAKQHGVHRVARELRLDYNGLKNRVGPVGSATGAPKVDAKFVELFGAPAPTPTLAPVCECAVELENARGAKMRVQLNGHGLAGLERLCSSFWSAR